MSGAAARLLPANSWRSARMKARPTTWAPTRMICARYLACGGHPAVTAARGPVPSPVTSPPALPSPRPSPRGSALTLLGPCHGPVPSPQALSPQNQLPRTSLGPVPALGPSHHHPPPPRARSLRPQAPPDPVLRLLGPCHLPRALSLHTQAVSPRLGPCPPAACPSPLTMAPPPLPPPAVTGSGSEGRGGHRDSGGAGRSAPSAPRRAQRPLAAAPPGGPAAGWRGCAAHAHGAGEAQPAAYPRYRPCVRVCVSRPPVPSLGPHTRQNTGAGAAALIAGPARGGHGAQGRRPARCWAEP